ncbi:MAG: hypothetical protein ACQER1_18700 [Armatimonadota bacterium]
MPTERTEQKAKEALPILVNCAQKRKVITYSRLGAQIGVIPVNIGRILGYIRGVICRKGERAPMINALVVNKNTRLPGKDFLPDGTEHLSDGEFVQAFETHRDAVFAYERWDDLLSEYDLSPVKRSPEEVESLAHKFVQVEQRRETGGEGDEHARLKQYIASEPQVLGLPGDVKAAVEEQLPSGDVCDVVFRWPSEAAVVEVKGRTPGDLAKGVYQVIKYRALVEAVEGDGEPYPVQAFLVSAMMPPDIAEWAGRFGIECVSVKNNGLPCSED